jgi:hypothetical protein
MRPIILLPLVLLAACAETVVPPADMRFSGLSLDEARDRVVAQCMATERAEVVDSSRNRVVCVRQIQGGTAALVTALTAAASSRNSLVVTLAPVGDQVRAQGRIFFETESLYGRVDRSERTNAQAADFVTRFLQDAGARPSL